MLCEGKKAVDPQQSSNVDSVTIHLPDDSNVAIGPVDVDKYPLIQNLIDQILAKNPKFPKERKLTIIDASVVGSSVSGVPQNLLVKFALVFGKDCNIACQQMLIIAAAPAIATGFDASPQLLSALVSALTSAVTSTTTVANQITTTTTGILLQDHAYG
ncbi:unnamed protein product [Didymodactylos carnosus]|nr:unnamed protein product [Didymodactylos carnosus]CAF3862114.1 unnamed protein product [Didymodactylos carnosus]